METPVQLEAFSKQGPLRLLARPHPIELFRGIGFTTWAMALGALAGVTAFTDQNTVFMSGLKTLICISAGGLAVDALATGIRHLAHYRHSVLMITDHHIAALSGAAGIVRAYPRAACHVHPIRHSWLGDQMDYGLLRIDDPDGHHLLGMPIRHPDHALLAAIGGHGTKGEVSA